jgi:ABC-type multidrug transport system fused ATPase/permease subunit
LKKKKNKQKRKKYANKIQNSTKLNSKSHKTTKHAVPASNPTPTLLFLDSWKCFLFFSTLLLTLAIPSVLLRKRIRRTKKNEEEEEERRKKKEEEKKNNAPLSPVRFPTRAARQSRRGR